MSVLINWAKLLKNTTTHRTIKRHRTIKIKPVDIKSKTYINFNKENNYKNPKFKVENMEI